MNQLKFLHENGFNDADIKALVYSKNVSAAVESVGQTPINQFMREIMKQEKDNWTPINSKGPVARSSLAGTAFKITGYTLGALALAGCVSSAFSTKDITDNFGDTPDTAASKVQSLFDGGNYQQGFVALTALNQYGIENIDTIANFVDALMAKKVNNLRGQSIFADGKLSEQALDTLRFVQASDIVANYNKGFTLETALDNAEVETARYIPQLQKGEDGRVNAIWLTVGGAHYSIVLEYDSDGNAKAKTVAPETTLPENLTPLMTDMSKTGAESITIDAEGRLIELKSAGGQAYATDANVEGAELANIVQKTYGTVVGGNDRITIFKTKDAEGNEKQYIQVGNEIFENIKEGDAYVDYTKQADFMGAIAQRNTEAIAKYKTDMGENFGKMIQMYVDYHADQQIGLGATWEAKDGHVVWEDGLTDGSDPLKTTTLRTFTEKLGLEAAVDFITGTYGKDMTLLEAQEFVQSRSKATGPGAWSEYFKPAQMENIEKIFGTDHGLTKEDIKYFWRDIQK